MAQGALQDATREVQTEPRSEGLGGPDAAAASGAVNWEGAVQKSLKRIYRWRVPPNWGEQDWRDEIHSVAVLAACEAARDFDPARGTPSDTFVGSRVLSRALTHYRREWAYGTRHCDGVTFPEKLEARLPDQVLFVPAGSAQSSGEDMGAALARLPEQSRWLIQELFVHQRTETDIGRQLGISHQAVSKRKQAVFRELRQWLTADTASNPRTD